MQIYVLNQNSKKHFASLYDSNFFADNDENIIMLGAVENNTPIAVLCASVFMKEVSVPWVFVAPTMRRKKVATHLFKALIKTVSKCGAESLYLFLTKETEGIYEFLKSMQFTVTGNPCWVSYRAKLGDLITLPEEDPSGFRLSSFLTVGKSMVLSFNESLVEGESLVGVPLKIDPRDFSPFSCCGIVDDHISSLILVHTRMENGKEVLELPWMFMGKDSKAAVPAMYNATLSALNASFSPETDLLFNSINPGMNRIVSKIMPRAKCTDIFVASIKLKG